MDDFYYVAGRGTAYGLPLLEILLRLSSTAGVSKLHGVVRGHQHNNAAGVARGPKESFNMLWIMLDHVLECRERDTAKWHQRGKTTSNIRAALFGQSRSCVTYDGVAIMTGAALLHLIHALNKQAPRRVSNQLFRQLHIRVCRRVVRYVDKQYIHPDHYRADADAPCAIVRVCRCVRRWPRARQTVPRGL
jgi:hypothetical protein